ncbi:hypothetical protein [Streptomyces sp. NPDC046685]|uniref:hypothetical protein n=1 Tax=Streptomyces sp. NPDC046685 TaxID=3157202 RepID=UPI003407FE34
MSNDAADEQHGTEQLPLHQAAVVAACARAFIEWIGPILTETAGAPESRLIQAYEDSGQPSVVAKIGSIVAGTYTVNRTKGKFEVADEQAVDRWAKEHGGMEVIRRRMPSWEKALLNSVRQTDTGEIVDTRSGEVVPGLVYVPGGRSNGRVTFTWADSGEGKKQLLNAWRSGQLNPLLDGLLALPAPPADAA